MENLITISGEEDGYCKIGNFIIQWGCVAPGTRYFPVPFLNRCLSLATSSSSSGDAEHTSLTLIDNVKFEAYQQQGRYQRYIAVGY